MRILVPDVRYSHSARVDEQNQSRNESSTTPCDGRYTTVLRAAQTHFDENYVTTIIVSYGWRENSIKTIRT